MTMGNDEATSDSTYTNDGPAFDQSGTPAAMPPDETLPPKTHNLPTVEELKERVRKARSAEKEAMKPHLQDARNAHKAADDAARQHRIEQAEGLFALQQGLTAQGHRVSQRSLAEIIGLSLNKVNALLQWRARDYDSRSPYKGSTTRLGREAERQSRRNTQPPVAAPATSVPQLPQPDVPHLPFRAEQAIPVAASTSMGEGNERDPNSNDATYTDEGQIAHTEPGESDRSAENGAPATSGRARPGTVAHDDLTYMQAIFDDSMFELEYKARFIREIQDQVAGVHLECPLEGTTVLAEFFKSIPSEMSPDERAKWDAMNEAMTRAFGFSLRKIPPFNAVG